MEYIRNFRDLGNIPVSGGRAVRERCFYRCATLQEASAEDLKEIKARGVRVAFDFRDPSEELPREEEIYVAAGLIHRRFPMALNNEKLFKLQTKRGVRALFTRITLDDVKGTYRSLPFGNEGYRAVFDAMKRGETPFLFHCSAGKDRTGLCAALMLTLLGADEDAVLEDYMLSLKVRNYVARQAGKEIPKILFKYMIRRLEPLLIVHPELWAAAKEEILQRYGSFDAYFLAEYGIDEGEHRRLIAMYTEVHSK